MFGIGKYTESDEGREGEIWYIYVMMRDAWKR